MPFWEAFYPYFFLIFLYFTKMLDAMSWVPFLYFYSSLFNNFLVMESYSTSCSIPCVKIPIPTIIIARNYFLNSLNSHSCKYLFLLHKYIFLFSFGKLFTVPWNFPHNLYYMIFHRVYILIILNLDFFTLEDFPPKYLVIL